MQQAPRHQPRPLAPYQRAERQSLMTFVGFTAILAACGLAKLAAPDFFDGVGTWGLLPLMVMWFGYDRFAKGQIRCPICGKGIFERRLVAFGWPERSCSQCGRDLQIPDGDAR